jgi:hypothetical protein
MKRDTAVTWQSDPRTVSVGVFEPVVKYYESLPGTLIDLITLAIPRLARLALWRVYFECSWIGGLAFFVLARIIPGAGLWHSVRNSHDQEPRFPPLGSARWHRAGRLSYLVLALRTFL